MRRLGFAVWLTGLPCAGKSTLANLLQKALDELGFQAEVLDGDEVRKRLTKGLGYTRVDREENIRRVAYVAKLLTKVGGIAIVALISPYREARDRAKTEIQNCVEVLVECPLQVCMHRDVKGLYAKAISGEIPNFTGVSDPYEPPANPDIVVQTDRESPEESLEKIIARLVALNLIRRRTVEHSSEGEADSHPRRGTKARKVDQWSI